MPKGALETSPWSTPRAFLSPRHRALHQNHGKPIRHHTPAKVSTKGQRNRGVHAAQRTVHGGAEAGEIERVLAVAHDCCAEVLCEALEPPGTIWREGLIGVGCGRSGRERRANYLRENVGWGVGGAPVGFGVWTRERSGQRRVVTATKISLEL